MKKLLPVYPWPMHPMIAEALGNIEDVNPIEAKPGGLNPVLAIRKRPTWACDALIVHKPENLAEAVSVCIGDGVEFMSMGSWLTEQFKVAVVEFR